MLPVFISSCRGLVFHLHYILEERKETDLSSRSVDLSSKELSMESGKSSLLCQETSFQRE